MSRFTRTLIIGATLTAMHLAGMTAVAQAQATDQQATPRPPTERQVGEAWRHRQAGRHGGQEDQASGSAWARRLSTLLFTRWAAAPTRRPITNPYARPQPLQTDPGATDSGDLTPASARRPPGTPGAPFPSFSTRMACR